jgi:hypothetical protein
VNHAVTTMRRNIAFLFLATVLCTFASGADAEDDWSGLGGSVIVTAPKSTPLEVLAAREVRRYVYLRTGRLLSIQPAAELPAGRANLIVVARKDQPLARAVADGRTVADLGTLAPQQYLLKTFRDDQHSVLLLAGGDEVATLYAAYRFAELLGTRFYLDGDTIPDQRIATPQLRSRIMKGAERMQPNVDPVMARPFPVLAELGKPLFDLRGIQPFHDFPEGPDWWNRDDYLAILSQLPKLRMNFLGLHTYPEGSPNAEPTVWIGLADDAGEKGKVKFSYPASYQNTLRGNWGYRTKKTSQFSLGSAQLFDGDAFGAEVMRGLCPQPTNAIAANELFERTGALLRDAFQHAHSLGIKTCVGTETPLVIPQALKDRLQSLSLNPTNAATVQALYEGIFRRAMSTYPLDYFWFWTPETWTWEDTKPEQVRAAMKDLTLAMSAAKAVQATFQLATCGWVLGPPEDRGLFDKILPKDWPVSCINREVGKSPVEPGFAHVSGRPKWAIPWLEDDPALTSPQLWVGRMRQDAVDALQYGCNGLMGIHWRTRVLGPNVSALAAAAWDQAPWRAPEKRVSGWVGGQTSDFKDVHFADTEDSVLYQTVRYNMSLYRLVAPNGAYKVTLKFCEPHFDASGKRVFTVKLQGKKVLDRLDIFTIAGKNIALDYTFDEVAVTNGWLDIEFVRQIENPLMAALVVQGKGFTQKINCGGPAYADYSADLPALSRYQPTQDFYQDWALHQFGPSVAQKAAAVFERIDGQLPRPSDWVEGPGGLKPDPRPWVKVSEEYAFVDEFAALRSAVQGAGNAERFDYWLNTFRYLKAIACVNCGSAEFDKAMEKVKAEKDPVRQKEMAKETALPLRRHLIRCVGEVYDYLLPTVSTPGGLGTVANWEQHLQPKLITEPGEALAKALGEPLPPDCELGRDYRGPLRLIVPTKRTSVAPGEGLHLKAVVLAATAPREVAFFWRPLGKGAFHKSVLSSVGRGVYSLALPAKEIRAADFEYYLKAVPPHGAPVYYPATAPTLNQTVVIQPES